MPTSLRKTTAADSSPSSGVRTQERGSIVIDLVDAGNERLVFRGVAFDMVSDNPGRNADRIQHGVQRIFRRYPTQ